MARLIVSAAGKRFTAADGNNEPIVVLVSVTDSDGEPVLGLEGDNFKIRTLLTPPTTTGVIQSVYSSGPAPGFFELKVAHKKVFSRQSGDISEKWKKGTYLFCLAVSKGEGKGQNVLSITIPD